LNVFISKIRVSKGEEIEGHRVVIRSDRENNLWFFEVHGNASPFVVDEFEAMKHGYRDVHQTRYCHVDTVNNLRRQYNLMES
jgi:hypothetical protein